MRKRKRVGIHKYAVGYAHTNTQGKEMSSKRTNMGVSMERKDALQKAVLDIAKRTNVIVKWTDVANYMIDNYTKEAIEDIVSDLTKKD